MISDEDLSDDPRDRFTGTWICDETSEQDDHFSYPVRIIKDTANSNRIILENFGFVGFDEKPPYANVSGNSMNIPLQEVCNDNSMSISGSGFLVDKKTMNWNYLIIIGGDKINYTAELRKN
jgi:hypothetical protein